MNYLEKWKARKARENMKHEIRRKGWDKQKEKDKNDIISMLVENYGIPKEEIHTNGYWFHFHRNGLFFDFVNQSSRLCGDMHRLLRSEDERECVRDAVSIHQIEEYLEFQKEFNYRAFVIDGHPKSVLKKVMRLGELPLETVITLQNKATLHITDL